MKISRMTSRSNDKSENGKNVIVVLIITYYMVMSLGITVHSVNFEEFLTSKSKDIVEIAKNCPSYGQSIYGPNRFLIILYSMDMLFSP